MSVFRIFVEKKPDYAVEAGHVLADAKTALRLEGLRSVRLINRYDVEGLSEADFKLALPIVFSEPAVDVIYSELPELTGEIFNCENVRTAVIGQSSVNIVKLGF